jgi:hypothetical protein
VLRSVLRSRGDGYNLVARPAHESEADAG